MGRGLSSRIPPFPSKDRGFPPSPPSSPTGAKGRRTVHPLFSPLRGRRDADQSRGPGTDRDQPRHAQQLYRARNSAPPHRRPRRPGERRRQADRLFRRQHDRADRADPGLQKTRDFDVGDRRTVRRRRGRRGEHDSARARSHQRHGRGADDRGGGSALARPRAGRAAGPPATALHRRPAASGLHGEQQFRARMVESPGGAGDFPPPPGARGRNRGAQRLSPAAGSARAAER